MFYIKHELNEWTSASWGLCLPDSPPGLSLDPTLFPDLPILDPQGANTLRYRCFLVLPTYRTRERGAIDNNSLGFIAKLTRGNVMEQKDVVTSPYCKLAQVSGVAVGHVYVT